MRERREINQINWIKSRDQIADILTKQGVKNENIKKYIEGRKKEGESEV